MKITGGNRSIYNHEVDGKEIHLFEKTSSSGLWSYVDQLKLEDVVSYQNKDDNGDLRNSIQFVLSSVSKVVGNDDNIDFHQERKNTILIRQISLKERA